MDINDFAPITPDTLKKRTESELQFIIVAGGTGWGDWARAELTRRQSETLSKLIEGLNEATRKVYDWAGATVIEGPVGRQGVARSQPPESTCQ